MIFANKKTIRRRSLMKSLMKFMFLFTLAPTLLLSLSLMAETVQPLAASGSKYETYLVYESDVKQVAVLIDYEKIQTDCHGLDYLYEVRSLAQNRFIVSKKLLLKPLYICNPEFFKIQQQGVKIDIPVTTGAAGSSAHAEIIVPTESIVSVQLKR